MRTGFPVSRTDFPLWELPHSENPVFIIGNGFEVLLCSPLRHFLPSEPIICYILQEKLRFPVFIAKGVSVIVVGALCASIAVATRLQCSTTRPYRAALTWCRAYSRALAHRPSHCLAGCNSLQSVDIPHAWQVCTLYRLKKEMIEFIVVCSAMQPVKKSAAAGASCRRYHSGWFPSYYVCSFRYWYTHCQGCHQDCQ